MKFGMKMMGRFGMKMIFKDSIPAWVVLITDLSSRVITDHTRSLKRADDKLLISL